MTLRRAILVMGALLPWAYGDAGSPDAWVTIETAHVRVLSNAPPAKVADIAGQLEAFHATLDRTWRGLTRPLPDKVTVYAFKNDVSFDDYKFIPQQQGERLLGATQKDDEGFLIALSVTPFQHIENTKTFKSFQYPYETMFHEFSHHLLGAAISQLPAWVDEGIAQYASSFTFQSGRAELGRIHSPPPDWLKHEFLLAPGELVRLPSFIPLGQETKGIAYTESWLLVFYLMQHGSPRAGQLGAFLSALLEGTPQAEAFASSFKGATPDTLAREAREFYARGKYTFTTLSVADLELPSVEDVKPVTTHDSDLALAELRVRTLAGLPAAEETYRRLLTEHPDDARALAGRGLLLERQGRASAAEESYRQAVGADPSSFSAQFRLGRLLARNAKDLQARPISAPSAPLPPKTAEARERLTAALLIRPSHPMSLYYFGTTFLSDPGDRSAGIGALQAVLQAQPENFDAASCLARLERWAGDRPSAIAELSGIASRHALPNQVGDLRSVLLECDRLELQELAKAQGRDAGLAWVDRAIGETHDTAMVDQLRKWRDVLAPPAAAQP